MGEETQAGFSVVITVQGGRSPAGGGGAALFPEWGGGCSVGALASIQQSPEVLSWCDNQEIFDAVKCTPEGTLPQS